MCGDLEVEIARSVIWALVPPPLNLDGMSIRNTPLHVQSDRVSPALNPLPFASPAFAGHNLALALAIVARRLHLLHKSWSDLLPHNSGTRTTAVVATLNVLRGMGTASSTLSAQYLFPHHDVHLLAHWSVEMVSVRV